MITPALSGHPLRGLRSWKRFVVKPQKRPVGATRGRPNPRQRARMVSLIEQEMFFGEQECDILEQEIISGEQACDILVREMVSGEQEGILPEQE